MPILFTAASSESGECAPITSVNNDFYTFAMWIRMTSVSTINRFLAANHLASAAFTRDARAVIMGAAEDIRSYRARAVGNSDVPIGFTSLINKWYFVGATMTPAEARLYQLGGGGLGFASSLATASAHTAFDKFTVGARYVSGALANFWDGDIAQLSVWRANLETSDMLQLYRGRSPLNLHPEKLLAYWPLDFAQATQYDKTRGIPLVMTGTADSAGPMPEFLRPRRARVYSLPSAGGAAAYLIDGAASFPLAVSATMLEGRTLAGAASFPLAVSATMLEGRTLAGFCTSALTVAASMVYTSAVQPVDPPITPSVEGSGPGVLGSRRAGVRRRMVPRRREYSVIEIDSADEQDLKDLLRFLDEVA